MTIRFFAGRSSALALAIALSGLGLAADPARLAFSSAAAEGGAAVDEAAVSEQKGEATDEAVVIEDGGKTEDGGAADGGDAVDGGAEGDGVIEIVEPIEIEGVGRPDVEAMVTTAAPGASDSAVRGESRRLNAVERESREASLSSSPAASWTPSRVYWLRW